MRLLSCWLVSSIATALLAVTSQAQPQFRIVDLGRLADGSEVLAHQINNRGEIIGFASRQGQSTPALYVNGNWRFLDLGGAAGAAWDINDGGQIVGEARTEFETYSFLYDNGEVINLNHITGQALAPAYRINKHGVMTVNVRVTNSAGHAGTIAAVADAAGTLRVLRTFDDQRFSGVFGLNNRGQFAGAVDEAGPFPWISRAVIFGPDGIVDLGSAAGGNTSEATAINDDGVAIGLINLGPLGTRAFIYENGLLRLLPTLPGDGSNFAYRINNRGQIVGTSTSHGTFPITRVFLYDKGQMHDLSTLIPGMPGTKLIWANGLNDRGQILVTGVLGDRLRSVLLTPVHGMKAVSAP